MLTRNLLLVLSSFISLSAAFLFSSTFGGGGLRTSRRAAHILLMSETAKVVPTVMKKLSGKIIVSGIGSKTEDEFMLNLLNEQATWSSVVLATNDVTASRKRFLTRTARYSGLLNVLDFVEADVQSEEQLKTVLDGATAWIAFDLPQSLISKLAITALNAGVKRLVVTTTLPPADINQTLIPEFDSAMAAFEAAGAAFTGIRHGEIIDGSEDHAYEIVNSTLPCIENFVERGVLARVAAELLQTDIAANAQCGLSSAGAFSEAYLNVLRSAGLNRRQEVGKIFSGGLQRVARMTVNEYDARQKKEEEREAAKLKAKLDEEEAKKKEDALSLERSQDVTTGLVLVDDEDASITPGWDEDQDDIVTDEAKIKIRTEMILTRVWQEYDARMYTKQTTKMEFFDANTEKAKVLAIKELEEEKEKKLKELADKKAQLDIVDNLADQTRKQYQKLLALERKEIQNQKEISDTWVKYIYLLLEVTMSHCKEKNILFHNEDQFSQTLLLREKANDLRALCGLQPYSVVYDPLDASAIVSFLANGESAAAKSSVLGVTLDVPLDDVEQVMVALNMKHSKLLKSIPALRGASQIIDLAIETLKKELPPPPLSVNEIRRNESKAKQTAVSDMRLEKIKNRGKPSNGDDSPVGKM